jgi:uncharacterized repeat protein (TIGR01451 family)
MQFVCWPNAYTPAFDYEVDPNMEIATTASPCRGFAGGDTAVIYIFGPTAISALQVGSNQTLTLVAYLLAATPEDSDGDGLFDVWEMNATDLNGDGVIDIGPSLGADPNRRDIYVEVDWMEDEHHSHKPDPVAIQKVVDAFDAQGINLHVDAGPNSIDYVTGTTWGQYSKGNSIAHKDVIGGVSLPFSMAEEWTALKNANFGHSDKVFRHSMFVHEYSIIGQRSGSSGVALSQFFLVSLGTWEGTINQQAGTFMHELGHTLGLKHGGNEDDDPNTPESGDYNYKPNYLSVMNYSFQMSGLIINGSDGHFNYSQFDLPDLNEASLLEQNGLNDTRVNNYSTKYKFHFPYLCGLSNQLERLEGYYVLSGAQQIDWDCDGSIDTQSVQVDINGKAGSGQILTSWDDWSNLNFKVGNIGMAGITSPISITDEDIANLSPELTFEESLAIQQISDPRVQLTVTADPASIQPEGIVIYTFTMLNIDGQDANDVVVTDTLPAGFSYVPGSTSGATTNDPLIDGQDISWSSFVVPSNGGELTLTFQATASQVPGTYFNSVSGSSANGYVVPTGDTAPVEVTSPPSNLIFADGFESGNFSAWGWAETDGDDLSVSTEAAAVGTYGAKAVINDSNELVLYEDSPDDEKHYSARFYFHPNSAQTDFAYLFAASSGASSWVMCLRLDKQGSYYSLALCGKDDNSAWFESAPVLIADEWQAVELEWKAATSAGANDGHINLYIGGELADTVSNLDNDAHAITHISWGVDGPQGCCGTMYFDAFESRQGSYIGLDPNGPAVNPAPPRPDFMFADDFESGDLSNWHPTLTKTDNGDLSVSSQSAHTGAYGLQALMDNTATLYAVDASPAGETRYRARFHFHPNSLVMNNNTAHFIFDGYNEYYQTAVFRLELLYESGAYKLRPRILRDSWGYTNGNKYTISNDWHVIEIEWQTSSAPGANNGYLSLWIDDTLVGTIANVDNDEKHNRLDEARLGATCGVDSTTSGTTYFDNFESRRESYIGPLAYAPSSQEDGVFPASYRPMLPDLSAPNLSLLPLPNLPLQQTSSLTINYTYDPLRYLMSVSYSDPNNTGAGRRGGSYVYDSNGNVLRVQ